MPGADSATELRVYTHPACRSCQDVLTAARDLEAARDDVEVTLTSLASAAGRERAQSRDILVVPAVECRGQVVEQVLSREELAALVEGRFEAD
jgi:alkyl hydroperoxide reductase subunit AhpF